MEQSEYAYAGTYLDSMGDKKYLFNENIMYDSERDKQRIARSGYYETKVLVQGTALSVFPNSGLVLLYIH